MSCCCVCYVHAADECHKMCDAYRLVTGPCCMQKFVQSWFTDLLSVTTKSTRQKSKLLTRRSEVESYRTHTRPDNHSVAMKRARSALASSLSPPGKYVSGSNSLAVPPNDAFSWLGSTCSCNCCCPAAPPFRNTTFARVTGSMKGEMQDQNVEKSIGGLAMSI